MIKSEFKAFLALKRMIDINQIKLNSVKWVERINQIDEKKKTRLDETNWEKESDQSNQSIS